MKREVFWKAIGKIDEDIITEASAENPPAAKKKPRIPWQSVGSAAAVVAVIVGIWAVSSGRLQIPAAMDGMLADNAKGESILDRGGDPGDAAPMEDAEVAGGLTGDYNYSTSDTAGKPVTKVQFQIRQNGIWLTVDKNYPAGLPDTVTVINDYLTAADTDVRCISAEITSTPGTTVTSGELVTHTPGIRTASILLTADPGDDVLRGFLRTAPQFSIARYFHLYTDDGAELQIGDTLPPEGYDPRSFS